MSYLEDYIDYIEQEIQRRGFEEKNLITSSEKITKTYLGLSSEKWSELDYLVYPLVRMPATGAVCKRVLEELSFISDKNIKIKSVLDLGPGPATFLWSLLDLGFFLKSYQGLEKESAFIEQVQGFLKQKEISELDFSYKLGSVSTSTLPCADLVVASYMLNELEESSYLEAVEKAYASANQVLIIIDPGTPAAFSRMLKIREHFIQKGAHLIAPCPHSFSCPMSAVKQRWCHFAQRLSRTKRHLKLKGGSLGFEDEKFSYLIFSKPNDSFPSYSRVIDHPKKRSGCVQLSLCSTEGRLFEKRVSKKDKEEYLAAKKLRWGDCYSLNSLRHL